MAFGFTVFHFCTGVPPSTFRSLRHLHCIQHGPSLVNEVVEQATLRMLHKLAPSVALLVGDFVTTNTKPIQTQYMRSSVVHFA